MTRRRRVLTALLGLLLALAAGRAQAQFDANPPRTNSAYLDISIEAANHLRTAGSYAADRNWPEAIDLLQKLIDRFGDKVVQVGTTPVYLSVRDCCHREIARMPPEARAAYRQRADSQAESWFRSGVKEHDRELLFRVVERAFASSWGDNALDALAELAFEAGQFEESLLLWRRIETGSTIDDFTQDRADLDQSLSAGLTYPDTDLDRAQLDAKKILCHIFRGQRDVAARQIAAFRQTYPQARGRLGAIEGRLADRLAAIARETSPLRAIDEGQWTTFGGHASRSKVVPYSVDIGSVQWTTPLPQTPPRNFGLGGARPSPANEELLSYHPLVLRDWVLVSGREEVRAYDLHEGPKKGDEPLWTFRLRDLLGQPPAVARQASGSPHYTMTADRGRLYIRMGAPETTVSLRRGGQPDSFLVCLDLTAEAKEIWRIQPDEMDLAFEGSPVVADGKVYVGVTRGGAMTHAFVACYDAATGAKLWRQLICEASSPGMFSQGGSITHNLVTVGAGLVFYNSNLGAIAALDARTGRVRWIATYPRDSREEMAQQARSGSTRDLAPCVYHDGVVLAMPSDGSGVYAFDAISGDLRWRVPDAAKLTHMLGVAHGNLICTGNQVVAIEVATGRRVWQWSDGSGMTGFGRGTLAGDFVYFPTKTHVYVLDQRSGVLAKPKVPLQDSHGQPPGNLIIAEGYMVVAQPKSLTVFCQYDVLINRYRELIAQNPRSADPHFRLARAAEASGDTELAVEHYRAALRLVPRGESDEDRTIRQVARTQLYSLLGQLAQQAAKAENWPEVERYYRDAASVAPSPQGKLDVVLRLADMWAAVGDAGKALAAYQELLADEPSRGLVVQAEGNRSVRADVEIAARVQSLLDRFGREAYARFEREAEQSFAEAQQAESLPGVERMVRSFPNSQAVTAALEFIAGQHAADKRYVAATSTYRQLLARPETPSSAQVNAMIGLAQAYESARSWQAARAWWQRLAQEFPDASMTSRPEQSAASFVAEHLSRPPFDQLAAPGADRLQLPLSRRWTRTWSDASRVFVPDGQFASDARLRLLVSHADSAECVAAATGESLWTQKVAGPIRWVTHHEDQLLIGTDSQLMRVEAASGEILWQQRTSTGLPGFAEFQLVDDRVFLREESRKLTCLAAGTGTVLWTFTLTEGAILPNSFFSGHHVALRTQMPGRLVVLDGDGRRRFELTQLGDPWEQPPAALDGHRLAIATDSRTIQMLDLDYGKPVWTYAATSSDQRPVPIVGQGTMLVLAGGSTLVRLDPETGRPMWSSSVADEPLPRHANTWAIDGQMFYCMTRKLNLRAFRLSDGKLEWQQALTGPGDEWQVTASGGYVVALPRQPHATDGLPVVFCRQSDGRPVQRLYFRPRGDESLVNITPQHAVIGSEREVWALGKQDR